LAGAEGPVTYGSRKIGYPRHVENTAWDCVYSELCIAYFARALSNMHKMFMKLTTGVNAINIVFICRGEDKLECFFVIFFSGFPRFRLMLGRRYDTQHDDNQHSDTKHIGIICNIQHK
jgi:hypothetical protein